MINVIKPKVELLHQTEDFVAHVAKCARICYRSERANDDKLYQALINRGHLSMFRHESVYAIIDNSDYIDNMVDHFEECPYIDMIRTLDKTYVATNKQFILDKQLNYPYFIELILNNRRTPLEFENSGNEAYNMMRYTFCIDTQISTSREFNRVSPNNIAEESTRYVFEDRRICQPHWFNINGDKPYKFVTTSDYLIDDGYDRIPLKDCDIQNNYPNEIIKDKHAMSNTWFFSNVIAYLIECRKSFDTYSSLIDNGMPREDARGLLPLDTATRVIYTYSIKEWSHILDLRYYGTTGKPHPNAKIIASGIRDILKNIYNFR